MNTKTNLWRQRIGIGVGMLACNIPYSIVNTYLLIFFTNAVGLNPLALSLMFLITKLFDGVTDFIVGFLIDRTNTKFGRNRPWMLAGIPVLAIGFILVFSAPTMSMTMHLVWAYVTYIIFSFGYTLVNVPMNSIVPLLSSNPDERTNILTFGNIGGTLGVAVAMVIVPAVMTLNGGLNVAASYTKSAVLFAIVASIVYAVCVALVKEVNTPPKAQHHNLFGDVKDILKNKMFIILITITLFNALALASLTSSVTYYGKYILSDEAAVTKIYVVFLICSFIGLFFASALGKRFSKKPLLIGLMFVMLLSWTTILLFADNANIMYIAMVFYSLAAGMSNPNIYAILSDSVDYGEYKCGKNLAGSQTAFFGLSNKIGSAVASAIVAFVLSVGKFNAKLDVQPASALTSIKFSYAGIGFICMLFCMAAMMFYPVTREKQFEITKALEERRKQNKNVENENQ